MSSPRSQDALRHQGVQETHGLSHSISSSANLAALDALPRSSSSSAPGNLEPLSNASLLNSSCIPLNSSVLSSTESGLIHNVQDCYGCTVTVSPNLTGSGCTLTKDCVNEFYLQVLSYGKHWHTSLAGLYVDHNNPFLNMLAFEYYVAAENFENAFVCQNRGLDCSKHYEPHVMPFFANSRSALTDREKLFLKAYDAWSKLDFRHAGQQFENIAKDCPADQFAMKRAQLMYFQVGDHVGMLRCLQYITGVLPAYYHGMLSFALEQTGQQYGSLTAALHGLRIAQQQHVNDPWVVHSAAHSLFFKQLHPEGAAMQIRHCRDWEQCMGFMFGHNWFHVALAALDYGDLQSFFSIFDTAVWTQDGDPVSKPVFSTLEDVVSFVHYTRDWSLDHTLQQLGVSKQVLEPVLSHPDTCQYCAFHENSNNAALFQQSMSVPGLEHYQEPFVKQRKTYSQDIASAIGQLQKVETRLCVLGSGDVPSMVPALNERWESVQRYTTQLSSDPFLVSLQLLALSRRKHERQLPLCDEFEKSIKDMLKGDSNARAVELQQSALLVCHAARCAYKDEFSQAAALLEQVVYGETVHPSSSTPHTIYSTAHPALHLNSVFDVYPTESLEQVMNHLYMQLDQECATISTKVDNKQVKTFTEYCSHPLDQQYTVQTPSQPSKLAFIGGSNEQRVVFEDILIHWHLLANNFSHVITLLQRMPAPLPNHYQHLITRLHQQQTGFKQ